MQISFDHRDRKFKFAITQSERGTKYGYASMVKDPKTGRLRVGRIRMARDTKPMFVFLKALKDNRKFLVAQEGLVNTLLQELGAKANSRIEERKFETAKKHVARYHTYRLELISLFDEMITKCDNKFIMKSIPLRLLKNASSPAYGAIRAFFKSLKTFDMTRQRMTSVISPRF